MHKPENNEVYIDYITFISNTEYYENLADQGCIIHINVGEKYKEAELDRISNQTTQRVNILEPDLTRGTSWPTTEWNLSTLGQYSFSGRGNVYTNYYFTGKMDMPIYVYNSTPGTLTVQVFDSYVSDTNPALSFSFSGGEFILYPYARRRIYGQVVLYFAGQHQSFAGYIE